MVEEEDGPCSKKRDRMRKNKSGGFGFGLGVDCIAWVSVYSVGCFVLFSLRRGVSWVSAWLLGLKCGGSLN